ncbi:hypothetical protein BHS09_32015 [Myxococcus xanthus]|uniref:Amidase domain-containing protein n=1 Tax=Myxococcus xanthus TaxID=34 RepID=A0AAE6G5L1_MYXXA|nr:amidase family protein [Myxococcus xanthus]QDE71232.1 hypothetical protein BHS09_32015 [Myxococcus xanthus]QDE78512.1 hypothetical protein BHS08_32035 [Myxococcus xanthus]
MNQEGHPLTHGARFGKDDVPDQDSELVKRHRRSGLVVLGKSNTPEMGLRPTTESELHGPCRNPWDTSRSPGGAMAPQLRAAAFASYCPMANTAGLPTMSMPLHWSPDGLPVGVQVHGALWR